MPVTWFPPLLATRNLFYTAVTRGKTAVVLVGSEQRMHDMVDNNSSRERYSGLGRRLAAYLNGRAPMDDIFSSEDFGADAFVFEDSREFSFDDE